ncbi:hypothetical protein M9H77_17100 [Catharanthus roseus]|uniref:Uncharacterized protein n=1 Tax=Catharanthus roseus TaxID=4058 RepID=A0ACC0B3N1_CATRO|nr:hypothetical protein M9H77_17100 [Catharanthus roseus]
MEENHISESGGEVMLNDGSSKEGELREGSDDAEELQEPRGQETEQVLPISIRKLEMHDTARLRPSKSVRISKVQIGRSDKLGCLPRDCRNYVQKLRRLNIGAGDADCINRMFIRMHKKNIAYEEFNDVVYVDSAYLVNRSKMPNWLAAIAGDAPAVIMTGQCESIGECN